MRRLLEQIQAGRGTKDDLDLLRSHAEMIEDSAWCGVANTIRDPLLALLDAGAEHFAAHLAGRTCPPEKTLGWVTAPCRSTCPSNVDCPSYIFQVAEGHPFLATGQVKRDNPLPMVIGRTCHHPCESNCTLQQVGQPIAINSLKRWAADRAEGLVPAAAGPTSVGPGAWPPVRTKPPRRRRAEARWRPHAGRFYPAAGPGAARTGAKVAIIGAGPAGLSAGYYLARLGYRPVIFEALPVPGGMLYVGIPEYRLPKAHLRHEVALIEREGVEIRYNQAAGRDFAFADLEEMGFGATFLAIGAHSGKKLRIPGEELPGSMDAIDFLRQVALGAGGRPW